MTVAIVGGGVIGLSIAWRSAQRGEDVTVFDRQPVGTETSSVAAGMLAPGGEITDASPHSQLLLESRALYSEFVRELEAESKQPVDYQQSGGLDLAYSDEAWTTLQVRAARQAHIGIASEQLDLRELAARWPQVRRRDLQGAQFYPNDGFVDSRTLVAALRAACLARGVTLREWNPVTNLALDSRSGVIIQARERYVFDAAVLAAGAWSTQLPLAGVPLLPPVEPIRGHILAFEQSSGTCPSIVRRGHTYVLQRANGLLLAGASMERAGFDRTIAPSIVQRLAEEAAFLLPVLAHAKPPDVWLGFRPKSDELQLTSAADGRLYFAYGHYRNGILLAPVTALRMAQMISGKR